MTEKITSLAAIDPWISIPREGSGTTFVSSALKLSRVANFTLPTQLIKPNCLVTLLRRCSNTVSL